MSEFAIKMEHVSKEYRLGAISGGTLREALQEKWAKLRHRASPNAKIGAAEVVAGTRFLALDDVSFSVKKGEALGIIGHNGAGKSTLLKLLSRVTAPTSGTISYNGRIASMLEVGTGFHPELTGRENVYMNGAILGMSKAEISRKFDEIVEFAELQKFIDTPVKRYSSGMYVKLAFAVSAHLDSEILVMDEVLAVGDMKFQDKCLEKMKAVASGEGRTVLYVSHNMSTIKRLCDRCIVLDHGRKVFDGGVIEAIDVYSNRNTEVFTPLKVFEPAPYWDYYMRQIQMLSFELINTDSDIYKSGDTVEGILRCHSDVDLEDVCIRMEVFNGSDSLLGIYETPLSTFSQGEKNAFLLKLPTTQFSAGNYKINLALYIANNEGMSTTIDLARDAIRFSLIEDFDKKKIIGDCRLGGFLRFKGAEVKKI